MVVEDDRGQADVLRIRLERLGYRVSLVSNGREVPRAAAESAPDVILLDVRLPDADGLDLCAQLADAAATAAIPVIIVSAVEGANIVRKARAAGCRYFVHKPYDPNALLLLIEDSLGAREGDLPTEAPPLGE